MILVTGASGFLGQHLLEALAQQPLPVRALYHTREPKASLPHVTWVSCDLLDIFAVAAAMKDVTQVYHCAAIVSYDPAMRHKMIRENVDATANVVNAALEAGVAKLIHVSSIAALGLSSGHEAQVSEDTHWEEGKESSAYAESKFLSEMEVWRAMAEGLNAAIVNPGIILGEGEWDRGSSKLMEIVYKEFPWYTEGATAWVDVKDVAEAMILLMNSDISEERFILSGGNFAHRDVFTRMANALHRRPPFRQASPFMTEIVWRAELFKSRIAGKEATITRETARSAQRKVYYNNNKFREAFPRFHYHALDDTIYRMAGAFVKNRH